LFLLLISFISCNVLADNNQDNKLDLLIVETQKFSDTTFIWWLPQEYWSTSAELIKSKETALAMEVYSEYFRPYIVMLVAHTEPTSATKARFFSESDILSNIRLVDGRGFSHYPLPKKTD
jgi:hypothetical protein